MLPWIVLFLMVSTNKALNVDLEASPGGNVTLNCTFGVDSDERSPPIIGWRWKPVDEVDDIDIFLKIVKSKIKPNTRFSDRLILVGNINDGDASLLLKTITPLDSGVFTCEHCFHEKGVISQTNLHVRPPEEHEAKISHTGNVVPWIVVAGLIIIIIVLFMVVYEKQKPQLCNPPNKGSEVKHNDQIEEEEENTELKQAEDPSPMGS